MRYIEFFKYKNNRQRFVYAILVGLYSLVSCVVIEWFIYKFSRVESTFFDYLIITIISIFLSVYDYYYNVKIYIDDRKLLLYPLTSSIRNMWIDISEITEIKCKTKIKYLRKMPHIEIKLNNGKKILFQLYETDSFLNEIQKCNNNILIS